MGNSQQVYESIFNRSMFENDTKDFLTGLTKEYPYFTAAQFYLLQKNETGSDDYNKQLAKTAVLFNNPFWLNYQVEQCFGSVELPEPAFINQLPDNKPQYNVEIDGGEIILPLTNATETIYEEEKIVVPEQYIQQQTPVEMLHKPVVESPTTVFDAEVKTLFETTEVPIEEEKEELLLDKTTEQTEHHPDINNNTEINNSPETNEENYQEKAKEIITNKIIEPVDNSSSTELPLAESPITEQNNISENNVGEEDEEINEKEIEPLNFKLNFTTSTTTEDTISFEPLHTSDYFASLGIKFSDEVKADDKFGKHLKSFTEWLKTMKKIHPDQLPQQTEQSESSIQQMAEKSNTEGEVLTEAMAEVLLQQGKLGKAIELYQKLSLLNPLKSAYFAAKINAIER